MSLIINVLVSYNTLELLDILGLLGIIPNEPKRVSDRSLIVYTIGQSLSLKGTTDEEGIIRKAIIATAELLRIEGINRENYSDTRFVDDIYNKYQNLIKSYLSTKGYSYREKLAKRYEDFLAMDGRALVGGSTTLMRALAAGEAPEFSLFVKSAISLNELLSTRKAIIPPWRNTAIGLRGIMKVLNRKNLQRERVGEVILKIILDYKIAVQNQSRDEWSSYALEIADKLNLINSMITKAEKYLASEERGTADYRQTDWYQWFQAEEELRAGLIHG